MPATPLQPDRPPDPAPSTPGWPSRPSRAARGGCGGRTWPGGSGAPSARTTRPTATPGPTSPSSRPTPAPTGGARTAWAASATGSASSTLGLALWNGQRPDPQGAAVRADQRRGQPRRGRQGVLVGRRRHADPLLDAVALPLPAGRVPVRAAAGRERHARPRRARVRAGRHRGARPRTGSSTCTVTYAKAAPDDVCDRDRGDQPRPRRGPAAPAAAGLVPQHLGVGPRRRRSAVDQTGCRPARPVAGPRRRCDCEHGFLGRYYLRRRRARPRCWSATTRPTTSSCSGRSESTAVHQGRHRPPRRRTATSAAVNPAGTGTKAAFWYRFDAVAPGQTVECRAAAVAPTRPTSATFGPGFDAVLADRARRGRRVLRPASSRRCSTPRTATSPAGRSPGCCGASSSTATTSTSGSTATRPSRAPPDAPDAGRRNTELAPPGAGRRHLDARRVGVPLVRRLGPRPSTRRAGPRRPGVRQGAAGAAVPRVGDAPQRAAAGLRVGVRRRQPAGARLGGLAGLPDRRPPRPRLPGPGVHQAAAELRVVGQPQGRRRLQPVRGRLPRHGQHRPVRPVGAAAARRPARGVRRDQLDGVLLPAACCRSRSSWRRTTRPGTTWRPSSSSTSCRSPTRCAPSARRTSRSGTRRTASSTTCSCTPTARASGCGCARWSDCCRCSPWRTRRPGSADALPDFTARLRWLQRRRPELLDGLLDPVRAGRRPHPAVAARRRTGCGGCWRGCSTSEEFLSPYGIRSLSAAYREPYSTDDRRRADVDRLRAGRVAHRAVRRQLELARAGVVPGERPAGRRAAHLRRLPRGRRRSRCCGEDVGIDGRRPT